MVKSRAKKHAGISTDPSRGRSAKRDQYTLFYDSLNKEQKKAVDTIEGPVMVIAGPGTGKTQILTLRIANVLKRADINPENILALTFTENAASSMKKRLAAIIGPTAYSVNISTFHGFANDLILSSPEYFEGLLGAQAANEGDRISIIRKGLRSLKLKELRPLGAPDFYVREIISGIEALKREGVLPDEFRNIIEKEWQSFSERPDLFHEKGAWAGKMKGESQKQEKYIRRNIELAQIYSFYQLQLRKERLYDYADMILEVMLALGSNETLRQSLQEKYQYILIDEHQDTNRAQNKIIELICSYDDKPNLFIVGDEKQAIYRFQGASLENFEYFKKKFPSAKIIFLETNYRSHQGILDSAHSILAGQKQLRASGGELRKIDIVQCENIESEHYYVASQVEKDIKSGIAPQEIAILYRDNKDSVLLSQGLASKGISFSIESDRDVLEDTEIFKFLTFLTYLVNPGDETLLAQVLQFDFLKLPTPDAYKIMYSSFRERRDSLSSVLASEEQIKALKLPSGTKAHELYLNLVSWSERALNDFILESLEFLAHESGFMEKILSKPHSFELVEKLRRLFDEARMLAGHNPQARILEFIEYINLIREHKLAIKRGGLIREGRVRCMTAHSAKGLEFDRAYMIGANDGHWGNRKRHNLIKLPESVYLLSGSNIQPDNNDERRLFYVAMTRARHHLTISYTQRGLDGSELLPSQFISEIRPELVQLVDFKASDIRYSTKKSGTSNSEAEMKSLIKQLFTQQGLSVTALNNYLECPWKYFYVNLIRIPTPIEPYLLYGTAVHCTLDDFLKNRNKGKEYLIERFRYHMDRQPMSGKEIWRWLEKGEAALRSYYDQKIKGWKNKCVSEFSIRDVFLTDEIKLNGKIDKIEIINERNEVNVVDYKTGSPKSRNEIEGKTKNSNGDIKRQLVFYRLLLDGYKQGGAYKMISAQIDFIEPDQGGKHRSEIFHIDSEEVNNLKELIKKTAREILEFKFANNTCSDHDCIYCTLRKMTV